MPTPVLTRKRTPFDDISADAIQEFATFVRTFAPRWLNGSRSLSRLMARRKHQQVAARGRRHGARYLTAPAHSACTALQRQR